MEQGNPQQFNANQWESVQAQAQPFSLASAGGGWGDEPKEKKPKVLNDRYLKIKKLGQGSFGVVYLAEDLLPKGKSRLLSKDHLDKIGKLPDGLNPYR